MNLHRCPGLSSRSLMTYLAALGLAKVVSEQADADVRFGWTADTFVVNTTVDDLVEFLIERYRPTPVVSPWNGGSGFGAKDKSQLAFLDEIESAQTPRLSTYAVTIRVCRAVLAELAVLGQIGDKIRMIQELRNRVPDEALPWLDTSVVLTTDAAAFPPILGTGGNDGRLDYSSNFHQRLTDVLPELGASPHTSRGWARDLLLGSTTTKLQSAAIGQFDALGAGGPGSSAFGSADSRVNPWAFVLMLEGVTWFASSAARRLGEVEGRAAMPFTVFASSDGPVPGAAKEEARGELWAPVFTSVTARHLTQIMREARAVWQGKAATKAAEMYGAVRTFGVDRGIERFQRFGYLQRNGLAYVAVLLDTVNVDNRPTVSLAAAPMRRAAGFAHASGEGTNKPEAIRRHTRAFDAAALTYLRDPRPAHLLAMLEAQTRLELVATRSDRRKDELRAPTRQARSEEVLESVDDVLRSSAEARVAAGLASASTAGEFGERTWMRDLLLGSEPGARKSHPARAFGLGNKALDHVLADLVVWRAQHPMEDHRVGRGTLIFLDHRWRTPWADVHAWVGGVLDDELLERYFLAFLALDWRQQPRVRPQFQGVPLRTIDPDLAVLQGFMSADVFLPGVPVDALDGRLGIADDWPLRLRAGQVDSVATAAATILRRHRVRVFTPSGPALRAITYCRNPIPDSSQGRGTTLLAALCAPASTGPLRALSAIDRPIDPAPAVTQKTLDEGAFT